MNTPNECPTCGETASPCPCEVDATRDTIPDPIEVEVDGEPIDVVEFFTMRGAL